jgi:CBS domain-containing protein
VAGDLIYAFRVMRLPMLEVDGAPFGRVADIVLAPTHRGEPPRVLGFVVATERSRIFVNAARLASLDNGGARLRSSTIDLKPFQKRAGELLVGADLLDRRVGNEVVTDLALRPSANRTWFWEVAAVALGRSNPLRRRRTVRVVDWEEVAFLFATSPEAAEVASLRDLRPADVAAAIRNLPLHRRKQLAEVMEDERLADLLEELPEAEQLRIVEGLGLERVVSVLEEMAPDDAADLLAEMPGEQRTRILDAMEPEEAADLRRLLTYGEATAGGLMTSEPLVATPTTRVAEALARVRDPDQPVAVAAQVFVCQPPTATPTGTYLGTVGFQRLLREPPSTELGRILDEEPPIPPDLPDKEVAERLAAYNLLAVPVCDELGRLLGAVTVDDVLDHTLPVGWRQRRPR